MPQEFDARPFQIDHVRARKHRGKATLDNLTLACLPCNAYKGPNVAGYDPQSDELHRLFNPRVDRWSDHFGWNGPFLHGKTSIGRATVDVLRINDPERVAHRRMLFEIGVFP